MATLKEILDENAKEMEAKRKSIEWDQEEELTAIRKSKRTVIVVKRLRKGSDIFYDIRNFLLNGKQVIPTQKGVLLTEEQAAQVVAALKRYV